MSPEKLEKIKELVDRTINTKFQSNEDATIYYETIGKFAASALAAQYDIDQYTPKLHVMFADTAENVGAYGLYSSGCNAIVLDEELSMKNINRLTLTAIHEGTHLGQMQSLQKGVGLQSQDDWLVAMSHQNIKRNVFGVAIHNRAYISANLPDKEKTISQDFRSTYYRAQFIERQALEMEIKLGEDLGLNTSTQKNTLERVACELKEHLSRWDLTDREIFQLVDDAQYKIIRNIQPTNSSEAKVMLDLAGLIFEQEAYTKEEMLVGTKAMANIYLSPTTMANKLTANGFVNAQVLPYALANETTYEQIENMSQELRDQSPAFMGFALARYGYESIAPLINFELFNDWYFSAENFYLEQDCQLIANTINSTAYNREVVDWAAENGIDWHDIGKTQFYDFGNQKQQFEENLEMA